MKEYEVGDRVEYQLLNEAGKGHWFKGVIHGVRRYEDPATNTILRITYLVDTGRNVWLSETPFDHRDREINRRINLMVKPGFSAEKALHKVLEHTDLPESRAGVERIRQPEQLELPAKFIRPRK